jgi:uridine kinase
LAYIVGISGGSASGKTTLIQKLKQIFDESQLAILSQDHYYKPIEFQIRNELGEINFDEPESLDLEKFLKDIELLEAGYSLEIEEYVFNNPDKIGSTITVNPAKTILIEGIFIIGQTSINDKLDFKIFIDADEEIKYNRRLKRDSEERGMDRAEIHYQWHSQVLPSYQKYLLPHKEKADILITNNYDFEVGLNLVIEQMQKFLIT